MGYAKKPGGFWDSLGIVVVLAAECYFLFWFLNYVGGTMDLFWDFTNSWFVPVKTFMLYEGGFVLVAALFIMALFRFIWKGGFRED